LRGGEAEEVATQLVHLRFEGFVLLLVLSVLDQDPDNETGQKQSKNGGGNVNRVHAFSEKLTGNGNSNVRGKEKRSKRGLRKWKIENKN
jgi:hypothetical protein